MESKTIEFDESMFGTNNGTMDLMKMSRNMYHKDITSSFRSRNLVSKRAGRELLESMSTRSTPTPPGGAAPTETDVARDLAKTQNLIGLRELGGSEYQFPLRGGLHRPEQALGWLGGLVWG